MKYIALALALALTLIWSTLAMADHFEKSTSTAILAGGCFWCVENDLSKLEGVTNVVSGYAGGDRPNPSYENYAKTSAEYPRGHIESVQVTYNPKVLSYEALITYHLRHIDPTDGLGQFCDRGESYRPAIFAANETERQIAEAALAKISEKLGARLNVEILPSRTFWPAEAYHQDYAQKNPLRYKLYRYSCRRDQKIEELWTPR